MNTQEVFDAILAYAQAHGATATYSRAYGGSVTIHWDAAHHLPLTDTAIPDTIEGTCDFNRDDTPACIRELRKLIAALATHRQRAAINLVVDNRGGFELCPSPNHAHELHVLTQSVNSRMNRCPPPASGKSWTTRQPEHIFGWPATA